MSVTVQVCSHDYDQALVVMTPGNRPAIKAGQVNIYFDTWAELDATLDDLRSQAAGLRPQDVPPVERELYTWLSNVENPAEEVSA